MYTARPLQRALAWSELMYERLNAKDKEELFSESSKPVWLVLLLVTHARSHSDVTVSEH